MEESREVLKKRMAEDAHVLQKISLRPKSDNLKYWDLIDKLRVVSKIEVDNDWVVLAPLIRNDLETILALQRDERDTQTDQSWVPRGLISENRNQFTESHSEDRIWDEAHRDLVTDFMDERSGSNSDH